MDEIYLEQYCKELGIKFTKLGGKKKTRFKFFFENALVLIVSPVDLGAQGFGEFFTWSIPEHECSIEESCRILPEYSIRAYVQILDASDRSPIEKLSFTMHHQNLESLLRSSIELAKRESGIQLTPILVKAKSNK